MNQVRLKITISGRVQGVGFRYSARQMARKLELNGMTRNEPDGKLYIEVEGDQKNIDEFLEWCSKGPKNADVVNVQSSLAIEPAGYSDFTVY